MYQQETAHSSRKMLFWEDVEESNAEALKRRHGRCGQQAEFSGRLRLLQPRSNQTL